MADRDRVELQAEIDVRRAGVWTLLATADGLARWLDEAQLEPRVGGAFRFRLRDAVAIGEVVALDPPQHVSYRWDWEGGPLPRQSIVAFDAIDHGHRTHLTVRHVGLGDRRSVELHDALWRHWFGQLCRVAEAAGGASATGGHAR